MLLYHAHSGVRYLVLLAGFAVLAYTVYALLTRRPYDQLMRRLGGAFAGLVHLQVLLGIGVLFTGRFYPALGGHIVLMVFAAVAAQTVPSVMRRRPMDERTFFPHLIGTLAALALIVAGILAIPGGQVFGSR
jgi:4-amino-4-deoxy-L-arabinose transferase-like glycosyltransferase